MGYKENKRAYTLKYQKENYVTFTFHLNSKYDGELINYLRSIPNKSGYIKELIVKDIKK
ncbi:MAG: hypothetical protein K5765_06975 [Clostridia bacterium]|nr:hypothetical protein [Clostridia bacterium]